MKLSLSLLLAAVGPALAAGRRSGGPDEVYEWDDILFSQKGALCADLAVIFARGTFDSGNIGPWVGPQFREALRSRVKNVAFQGVDPMYYAADLAGYIEDGGPWACASGLASELVNYATRCPSTKFVVSGWSQGALCAHRAFDKLYGLQDANIRDRVLALTTFGDPISVWSNTEEYPALPSKTRYLTYCESNVPDPLCRAPLDSFPSSASALIDRLVDMWEQVDETHMNDAQRDAVADLIFELPKQAKSQISTLARDIANGNIRRWLLTPQHFWYGIDGTVSTAAADIANLFAA